MLSISPLDDGKSQTRGMRGIMHYTVDRRLVLIGCFVPDITARVAVAGKPWEVAARHFQPDAVAWQEHIRRGPQVEVQLVDRVGFEQLGFRE